jgi:hypothetical protein
MMDHVKTVLWRNADDTSLEYCSLYSGGGGFVLEGAIILGLEQLATKVTYRIDCDSRWRTRYVELSQERAGEISRLALVVDETQRWQQSRSPLPLADGLFDVDFEISPVTNSLSIRRLNLKVGESAQSTAVWVRFPGLRLERLRQRYTRIDDTRYRYEAPELGFTAQLEVDKAGLIVKYGDLWMRIA